MPLGTGWWSLHLRRLHRQRLRTLLTVAALALSAATVVVVARVNESLPASMDDVARLGGGADAEIVARDSRGMDEDLVATVGAVAGVDTVAPLIRTSVRVNGTSALLLGADGRARKLGGELSARVQGTVDSYVRNPGELLDGVFVGAGLADALHLDRGGTISVAAVGRGERSIRVLDVIREGPLATLNDGVFVLALRTVAQDLSGRPGRVDTLEVVATSGTDRDRLAADLASVIGGTGIVSSASARAEAARKGAEPFRRIAALNAGIVVTAAALVVLDVTTIALWRRRRAWALQRCLGGRRKAIAVAALGEALLLGAIAGVVGLALGRALSGPIIASLPAETVGALRIRISLHGSALGDVAGLLVGPVAAVAATAVPLRRLLREEPIVALSGEPPSVPEIVTRRVLACAGLLGIAGAAVLAVAGTGGTAMPAIIGVLALGGGALAVWALQAPLAALAARLLGRFGPSARVGAVFVGHSPHRAWVTFAAVAAATSMTLAVGGVGGGVHDAAERMYAPLGHTALVVQTAPFGEQLDQATLDSPWLARLAALSTVGRMSVERHRVLTPGDASIEVIGLGPATNEPLLQLASPAARAAVADGTSTIITTGLAQTLHVGVGDRLPVGPTTGSTALPIVAVVDLSTIQYGAAAISLDRYESLFGPGGVDRVEVDPAPGADRATFEQQVRSLAADAPAPAFVMTGEDLRRQSVAELSQAATSLAILDAVVVIESMFAIVAALLLQVIERAREVGVVRALGSSPRRLRRAIVLEAAVLAVLGAAAGTGLGIILDVAGARIIGDISAYTVPPHIDVVIIAAVVCGAVGLACAAALGPAARAARMNVVDVLRE